MTITRHVAAAAAAMLISGTAAQAQSLGYGGKAGVNLIGVSFEDNIDGSARPGLVAGGFVTFNLGSRLSAEVDVYYSQRIFNFEEGDIEDRLAYVELPILARYRILTHESWHLSAV